MSKVRNGELQERAGRDLPIEDSRRRKVEPEHARRGRRDEVGSDVGTSRRCIPQRDTDTRIAHRHRRMDREDQILKIRVERHGAEVVVALLSS